MLPTPSVALTYHNSLQTELVGREPAVLRQCSGPAAAVGAGRDAVENERAETNSLRLECTCSTLKGTTEFPWVQTIDISTVRLCVDCHMVTMMYPVPFLYSWNQREERDQNTGLT